MSRLIEAAIAKTGKYAARDSGDSAELVERPGGGLSIVLIDGQGTGQAAKSLSLLLSAKAVGLIKEGVRDGAVARAVHDTLFAFRHGQVSATLDVVSVDSRTRTVVMTRNASTPLVIGRCGVFEVAPCAAEPLGLRLWNRPLVWELPLEDELVVVCCTDGVTTSGSRRGLAPFDVASFVASQGREQACARTLADATLAEAVERDTGRAADDMTVVVVSVGTHDDEPLVRRQAMTLPLPG